MADIFVSYHSSDRPRAEVLRTWFEECGWSTWIDREIDVGEPWKHRIDKELNTARVVVVLWSAQARRSEWVQHEANTAAGDGRLLQIHATGLPLLPPFDTLQAVRMQSWSGEPAHSERARLLNAVAQRLGSSPSVIGRIDPDDSQLPRLNYDLMASLELAFHYCARQVEWRRHVLAGEPQDRDLDEIRESFSTLRDRLSTDGSLGADDREGILHRMVEDFLDQLELLAPNPHVLH